MRIDRIRPILPGKPLAGRDREQKGRDGDRKEYASFEHKTKSVQPQGSRTSDTGQ